MAKRRSRRLADRQKTHRRDTGRSRTAVKTSDESGMASIVPRVLAGAVNGVEVVATGALRLTRDVLLSAVSGTASIGAEAVAATTAGARGVVSATSRMVAEIANTAQEAVREALSDARSARPGLARMARRSSPVSSGNDSATPSAGRATETRPRRRTRRPRTARAATPRAVA